MLSSIHPLGERSRQNRWSITAGAFTLAALAVAGTVGGVLGWAGAAVLSTMAPEARVWSIALVLLLAGLLDLLVEPPGPARQVNEHWIGHYRGWVYGASFGAELGAGLATYVVTWLAYGVLVLEFLMADWRAGAAVGLAFGLGRSVSVLAAGWIDRPSRLTSFHRWMADAGPPVRIVTDALSLGLGALLVWGGLTWLV